MSDSGISNKHSENRIHLFDPVGLINDSYGGYRSSIYGFRPPTSPTSTSGELIRTFDNFSEGNPNTGGARRSDGNLTDSDDEGLRCYDNGSSEDAGGGDGGGSGGGDGGLGFGVVVDLALEDESDVSTPRLWKPVNSPTILPTTNQYHQNMSPSSRTEVIARGRREMMEMVRDLPESFYELSLKDIVDHRQSIEENKQIDPPEEKNKESIKENTNPKENNNRELNKQKSQKKKSSKTVKKSDSKKKMARTKSVDNGGFLLRTSVFPSFLGSKKRNHSLSAANSLKMGSMPNKPQLAPTRSVKEMEKDWWGRKSCISSESDQSNGLTSIRNSTSSSSSGSSIRSNGIKARRRNRFLHRLCFLNGKKM